MAEVFLQQTIPTINIDPPLEPTSQDPALRFSWAQATTPVEAIERALYALADVLSGTVSARDDQWTATVYPRSAGDDQEQLGHRMRQEVTDQTLRLRIAERTDPIRNLVFALAFSNTRAAANDASLAGATPRTEEP